MIRKKVIKVGIAGNPNSGKTTIFNALTGARQKVGNYAGVTVEKKEGKKKFGNYEFVIFDLPGTYSLTAYSLDEVIARDFILEEKPDVVLDVLDTTNIERNLFLSLQFKELGIPVVCALNISDQASSMGITVDEKNLSELLGMPMIKTIGTKGEGIKELLEEVIKTYEKKEKHKEQKISYGVELEAEIKLITDAIEKDKEFSKKYPARWLAIKLLEKDANAAKKLSGNANCSYIEKIAESSIKFIESHFGRDAEIVVSEQRYGFVHGAVTEAVRKSAVSKTYITEIVDKVLLNRALGLPIFLFILWSIFQLTFKLGEYPMGWLEAFFGILSEKATAFIPAGMLQSLVVDGIIGGLGGVLSFVPLIIVLFLFISFLEDTGYMARAAFIMDKFLHIFGLHGQSFLPMMIGFGCSIPAIMASRTLKNNRDRIITILVTPFMSCGAKLPVHILLAAAFFPDNAANMVIVIYAIGVTLALFSSLLLRKTVLKGDSTPFVMELPPYRMPTLQGIGFHVWDKTLLYLKKAGTVLLAASILIWAILTFPQLKVDEAKYEKIAAEYEAGINKEEIKNGIEDLISGKIDISAIEDEEEKADKEEIKRTITAKEITVDEKVGDIVQADVDTYIETLQSEEKLSFSIAGRLGKSIEPVLKPLGFDWKIGISAITGFAAKEVVVSTLGILYKVGTEESEESESLRAALQSDKTFNPLVAFCLMLLTLIVAPCFAALATIKAEAGWKWLGFNILYTTVLAWILCFGVYRIGRLFGFGG